MEHQGNTIVSPVMTIYSVTGSGELMLSRIEEFFASMAAKQEHPKPDQVLFTMTHGGTATFTVKYREEETKVQSSGMTNFFSGAPLENQALRTNILQQISLFNNIIGIMLDGNEAQIAELSHQVFAFAKEIAGFVLLPSMQLYHNDGRLLLDMEGNTEFESFYPVAKTDFLHKETRESPGDEHRRLESLKRMEEEGITLLPQFPSYVLESNFVLMPKEDILRRLTAVFSASVRGEILGGEEPPEKKQEIMDRVLDTLNSKYQVSANWSADEKEFWEDPNPQQQDSINFSWRYECVAILLWVLSLHDDGPLNQYCNVSAMADILWGHDFNSLLEIAKLRDPSELLQKYDYILRCHWAAVEARIKQVPLPQVMESIARERHYAMNWLFSVMGNTDWDSVETHT